MTTPGPLVPPCTTRSLHTALTWGPVSTLLGNLLLLVPTAALAAAPWPVLRRPAALLLACPGLAAGIETVQYLLPLGRVVSFVDVGLPWVAS